MNGWGRLAVLVVGLSAVKWSRRHPFRLIRLRDVAGTSGTGLVAEGWQLPLGLGAVMRWRTENWSVTWYPRMEWVERIHGHNGATLVEVGPPKPYRWSGTDCGAGFDVSPLVDLAYARLTGRTPTGEPTSLQFGSGLTDPPTFPGRTGG